MIKKMLKKVPLLNKWKENIMMQNEYKKDYKFFINNYSHSNTTINKTKYNMLLIVHSLEKGMLSNNPRYFGVEKVNQLIKYIEYLDEKKVETNDYAYVISINALRAYTNFYFNNNWIDRDEYKVVLSFLENYKKVPNRNVGSYELLKKDLEKNASINYDDFLSSRHSIRSFAHTKLKQVDIDKAIAMAIKTPSACNRQMCKIYYVNNDNKRQKVLKVGQGFSGFDIDNVNIFIITFDVNANYFIGERNQGWFNSGLMAMNFVNALHSLGIGSCFIQFGNSFKTEESLKSELGIPSNERIAIIISAGYYEDKFKVTYSERKPINEVYKEIKD